MVRLWKFTNRGHLGKNLFITSYSKSFHTSVSKVLFHLCTVLLSLFFNVLQSIRWPDVSLVRSSFTLLSSEVLLRKSFLFLLLLELPILPFDTLFCFLSILWGPLFDISIMLWLMNRDGTFINISVVYL